MNFQVLKDYYEKKNLGQEAIDDAYTYLSSFSDYHDLDIDDLNVEQIKEYIRYLVSKDSNSLERLLTLARYYMLTDHKANYIYFTRIFGSLGVIEEIEKRLVRILGKEVRNRVFDGLYLPVLGEDLDNMPFFTKKFMKKLKGELTLEQVKKVLAGNNHQIPIEAMLSEKERFIASSNLDQYLKERHHRKVEELKEYQKNNKVWFEQVISDEVVDFVAKNQEILSATREGDSLFVTKIPYDTKAFLAANDEKSRQYYACHCSFVRQQFDYSHGNGEGDSGSWMEGVDADWCYCSGGFAKFPYEVMFDEDLEVELLKSPLLGDSACRFRITIPEKIMKAYVND